MRNISFALTTGQFRRREKTQTRRLGWAKLRPGELLMACVKCQGIPKGGKVERLGPIRVISVRREPLDAITQADVIAEGFPDLTPAEFVAMFCEHNGCEPGAEVTVIDFAYLNGTNLSAYMVEAR